MLQQKKKKKLIKENNCAKLLRKPSRNKEVIVRTYLKERTDTRRHANRHAHTLSRSPQACSTKTLVRLKKGKECHISLSPSSYGWLSYPFLLNSGECGARSDCTYVQADLALHSPRK